MKKSYYKGKCYCGKYDKNFIAMNATCTLCGKQREYMKTYMETVGMESVMEAVEKGTYISPKQLWYDTLYNEAIWADFDSFEKGVLEGLAKMQEDYIDKKEIHSEIQKIIDKFK